jgi:RimJ/RimL family protein N-acetyltransferase
MTVRPATLEDAEHLAFVHIRSWQAAYQGMMPQDYLDQLDVAGRTDGWRRRLENNDSPGTLVAVNASDQGAGRIVGFAGLESTRDADEDPARTGEVWGIYLLREAWGQGLGRELMTAALGQLATHGFQEATLWVLRENARARRFYEAAGFTADGTEKLDDIGGSPVTEVRYRRSLP